MISWCGTPVIRDWLEPPPPTHTHGPTPTLAHRALNVITTGLSHWEMDLMKERPHPLVLGACMRGFVFVCMGWGGGVGRSVEPRPRNAGDRLGTQSNAHNHIYLYIHTCTHPRIIYSVHGPDGRGQDGDGARHCAGHAHQDGDRRCVFYITCMSVCIFPQRFQ